MIPRILAVSPPRPGPWLDALQDLADAGVPALVLRLVDSDAPLAALLPAPPPGLSLLLRPTRLQDVDLAVERGLGVHLPAALDAAPLRPRIRGLLGQSCHDLAGLQRAQAAGCDYALLSPVFPPGSKPGDRRPTLGLHGLADLCRAVDLPVLALGGIDADRAAACVRAGAHGVAGISAFFAEGQVAMGPARAVVAALA